jgi:hypothetical protein
VNARHKLGAFDPDETFLMVAIRNLYWTQRIGAFIVGGLILAGARCVGSSARRPGLSGPQVLSRCRLKLRTTHKQEHSKDDKASWAAFSAPVVG